MQAHVVIRRNGVDADEIIGVGATAEAAETITDDYLDANPDVDPLDAYEGLRVEVHEVIQEVRPVIDLEFVGFTRGSCRCYIHQLIDDAGIPVARVRARVMKALRAEMAEGAPRADHVTAYGYMLDTVEQFEQRIADGAY